MKGFANPLQQDERFLQIAALLDSFTLKMLTYQGI